MILYKSLGKKSNDPRAITLLKEASLIKIPRTKKANSIFIILENWLSYDWSLQELNKTQRGNTQFPKSVKRKEQKYRWQMHRKNFSAGHTKSTSLHHCCPVYRWIETKVKFCFIALSTGNADCNCKQRIYNVLTWISECLLLILCQTVAAGFLVN